MKLVFKLGAIYIQMVQAYMLFFEYSFIDIVDISSIESARTSLMK